VTQNYVTINDHQTSLAVTI